MPVVGVISRWIVENGRRVAGQTAISLTATICVAAITQSFLKQPDTPVASPTNQSAIHELAALDLLKSMFGPGGARGRALYPSEFEAVAPPSLPRELATPSVVVLREPVTSAATTKPARKVAAWAAACQTDCPVVASPVALLPPARPTEMALMSTAPALAVEGSSQARPTAQARLLGIPIPRLFVATGETVVRSGDMMVSGVMSLGSAIGSVTSGLIP